MEQWLNIQIKTSKYPCALSLSLSLSVVMRGPGAACRWHDHEGLEEDCLEKDLSFSFSSILYILAMISSLYLYQSLFVSFFLSPSPFFQGERCSFSIQMWHYFLTGLRMTFGAQLPPCRPGRPLAQVLCETLEVLVQRYSRARPSYKRLFRSGTDYEDSLKTCTF